MQRGMNDIRGLRNIRGMQGTVATPKTAGSAYLDLFALNNQKERLEKKNDILERQAIEVKKRLEDINQRVRQLEAKQPKGRRAGNEPAEGKEMGLKRTTLGY